jgi:hypothetical protein
MKRRLAESVSRSVPPPWVSSVWSGSSLMTMLTSPLATSFERASY